MLIIMIRVMITTVIIMSMIIMTIIIMKITILYRPASYGSWQAQIATKVEGPSKEPGPFLYSGMILSDDDYGEDV